ncbi:hypothetical protein BJX70DRAFT_24011 [Aspergillus crustosus]
MGLIILDGIPRLYPPDGELAAPVGLVCYQKRHLTRLNRPTPITTSHYAVVTDPEPFTCDFSKGITIPELLPTQNKIFRPEQLLQQLGKRILQRRCKRSNRAGPQCTALRDRSMWQPPGHPDDTQYLRGHRKGAWVVCCYLGSWRNTQKNLSLDFLYSAVI